MTAIVFWGVCRRSAGRAIALLARPVASLLAAAGLACLPAQADFVPGRLYVAAVHHQGPSPAHPDVIYEFDPATGQSHLWTDVQPPYDLGTSALTFTPDGSRLLSVSQFRNRVTAWDGSAQPHEFLGLADNVRGPTELAYDPIGNLYVASGSQGAILRVPASGGPAEHFYGPLDGVGSMACAPNGDLFYATAGQNTLLRFSPEGELEDFHTFASGVSALAFDSKGTLFVCAGDGTHRFENANLDDDELLTSFGLGVGGDIALSLDQSLLYAKVGEQVWTIDAVTGFTTQIGTIAGLRDPYISTSIAVAIPEPPGCYGLFLAAFVVLVAEKYRFSRR